MAKQVFSWCGSIILSLKPSKSDYDVCPLTVKIGFNNWAPPWENLSYVNCNQQKSRSVSSALLFFVTLMWLIIYWTKSVGTVYTALKYPEYSEKAQYATNLKHLALICLGEDRLTSEEIWRERSGSGSSFREPEGSHAAERRLSLANKSYSVGDLVDKSPK